MLGSTRLVKGGRIRVLGSTLLLWLAFLACACMQRIQRFCATPNPNDYETWWDFQVFVGLCIWIPITLPPLALALLLLAKR